MVNYEKPAVPGTYAPRCSNYAAAALGACFPQELTHSWHFFGALRFAGWDFEVLPGKQGFWGTVRRFVKEHPKGTWVLNTKTHVILVKDGVVYDYAGRGPDGRRIKMAFKLSKTDE